MRIRGLQAIKMRWGAEGAPWRREAPPAAEAGRVLDANVITSSELKEPQRHGGQEELGVDGNVRRAS